MNINVKGRRKITPRILELLELKLKLDQLKLSYPKELVEELGSRVLEEKSTSLQILTSKVEYVDLEKYVVLDGSGSSVLKNVSIKIDLTKIPDEVNQLVIYSTL